MPKTKTNSSAKKRFKRTGSGALLCKPSFMRHNLRKRKKKVKRQDRKLVLVSKADMPRILRLLS